MTLQEFSASEAQTLIDRLTAQQHALAVISQNFAQDIPFPQTLPIVLSLLAETVQAVVARVILADESNTQFAGGAAADQLVEINDDLWAFIRQEIIIPDVETAPPNLNLKPLAGVVKSLMAVPLEAGGSHQGVLWLGFDQACNLPQDQQEFVHLVGLQIALQARHYLQEGVSLTGIHITDIVGTSGGDVLLILDNDNHIQLANASARQILGIKEQGLGKAIQEVIQDKALLEQITRKPEERSADYTYITADERAFKLSVSPIMGAHGFQIGALVVLWEVTRFNRIVENMSMFLHTVSHDLRSPLTAAKGFVDMLPMVGEINEKQESMIGKIQTSINDMTNLVEKVLDAGRLDPEMGTYQVRREPCDPNSVIYKAVSTLASSAQLKNIHLETKVDGSLPILNLDPMMLERAVINLVENAIKYTPDGGKIVVGGSIQNNQLIFSVQDNGPGIPAEDQERLFKKGERLLRKGERKVRGSGLGLFIVKNVAQQHSGDAKVESTLGEGSRFMITIPLEGPNLLGAGNQ